MTDNVIPLRGSIQTTANFTAEPTEEATSDLPMDADKAQMLLAITQAADFLIQNRDKVRYFVMATATEPTAAQVGDLDVAFHAHTSPIQVSDFALALKLLDNTFFMNLNGNN